MLVNPMPVNGDHREPGRIRGLARAGWLMSLGMFLSAGLAHPETVYVSGYREVMVRTGPTVRHRIIAVLKTGNPMQTLGQEGDYDQVSLPDGRQGYVLRSFLTREPPLQRQVEELNAKVETQATELEQLRGENQRLMATHDKLTEDHLSDRQRLRQLQQESNTIQRDMRLWWFVTGAGVLFIGWLMGWTRVRLWRKARFRSFT